jgi:hypothetical protein
MADEQNIGRDLEQSLKDSRKLQGDSNAELTRTINLLTKINNLREESIAKIKALNKETINVKQIEKERQKVSEKQQLVMMQTAKAEANLNDAQKAAADEYLSRLQQKKQLEANLSKAVRAGNADEVRFLGNQLNLVEGLLLSREENLGVEERSYAALVQSGKVLAENYEEISNELEAEKQIEKTVGLTGKLLNLSNKYLGLGGKLYGKIVEEARDGESTTKNWVKLTVGLGLAAHGAAKVFEKMTMPGSTMKNMGDMLSDMISKIPIVGPIVSGVVNIFKAGLDFILGINEQTTKFAKAMNMSVGEARQLKMQFADVNIANGSLLINTQKLVESQTEMVDLLGVTNVMSSEMLSTNVEMKELMGLEADVRASLAESFLITGRRQDEIAKSVFAQVEGLKQATGIQLENKKILKEASTLGGYLGLQFAKYPEKLTKSLVTVKAMGLELKQLDSIADSFLDFESSISKEFEAQLLTGKEINLNKARELFLNNDLAGAAMEINSQVGSSADFMKMNRIQADSLAQAFGMSRDQLGDMLRKQEMLSRLGAKDTDNAREQLKLGLAKYKNEKELAAAIGEQNYQNLVQMSLQEKIAAFIDKVKQSLADFVEKTGIIDKIEGVMNWLSNPSNIRSVMMTVRDTFATIIDVVATIAGGIIGAMETFSLISSTKEMELKSFLYGAGDKIRSMGGNMEFTSVAETSAKQTASSGNTSTNQSSVGGGNRLSGGVNLVVYNYVDPVTGKTITKVVNSDQYTKQDGSKLH